MQLSTMSRSALALLTLAAAVPEPLSSSDTCSAGDPGCQVKPDIAEPDDLVAMLQVRAIVTRDGAKAPADAQHGDTSEEAREAFRKHTAKEARAQGGEGPEEQKPRPSQLLGTNAEHIKYIAGVPCHNYYFAHPSGIKPSAMELQEARMWNIALPEEFTVDLEESFCKDMPGDAKCTNTGHPSEAGFGFIAVTATEDELAQILQNHRGAVYVEPDMPMAPIPDLEVQELDNSLVQQSGATWSLDRIYAQTVTDENYAQTVFDASTAPYTRRRSRSGFAWCGVFFYRHPACDGPSLLKLTTKLAGEAFYLPDDNWQSAKIGNGCEGGSVTFFDNDRIFRNDLHLRIAHDRELPFCLEEFSYDLHNDVQGVHIVPR